MAMMETNLEKNDSMPQCKFCEYSKRQFCESDCRHWIDFPEDENCCLLSIEKKGSLTLHEVAARLNLTHVRVKQIEDKVLEKIRTQNEDLHEDFL